MEAEPEPVNFQEFVEDLKTDENKPKEFIRDFKVEPSEGEPLFCTHEGCEWKTHKNAKDKKRGLKNHMKKCQYGPLALVKNEEIVEEEQATPWQWEDQNGREMDDNVRDKLIGDCDLLKVKFAHIPFTWDYSPNSSIKHLKRQKALFLRVISDEAGAEAVFNLLCLGSKAIEKVGQASGVVDIDGYASDVRINKDEIYPILKQMVDTGVLDIGHLSPELRLGMIMAQLMIARVEANSTQRSGFLDEEEE